MTTPHVSFIKRLVTESPISVRGIVQRLDEKTRIKGLEVTSCNVIVSKDYITYESVKTRIRILNRKGNLIKK